MNVKCVGASICTWERSDHVWRCSEHGKCIPIINHDKDLMTERKATKCVGGASGHMNVKRPCVYERGYVRGSEHMYVGASTCTW